MKATSLRARHQPPTLTRQFARDDQLASGRPAPSLPVLRFLQRPWPKSYTDAIPAGVSSLRSHEVSEGEISDIKILAGQQLDAAEIGRRIGRSAETIERVAGRNGIELTRSRAMPKHNTDYARDYYDRTYRIPAKAAGVPVRKFKASITGRPRTQRVDLKARGPAPTEAQPGAQ
jgi:hypothetical protein